VVNPRRPAFAGLWSTTLRPRGGQHVADPVPWTARLQNRAFRSSSLLGALTLDSNSKDG